MRNHKEQFGGEIDLIGLTLYLWGHKSKFILTAVLGLIFGLAYTHTHEQTFVTQFKVVIGHGTLNTQFFINSSSMQKWLNESELNPDIFPRITYKNKTGAFIYEDVERHSHAIIMKRINTIMSDIVKIKNSNKPKNISNEVILDADNIIRLISIENGPFELSDVLSKIDVSFGPTQSNHPNHRKYGLLGLFAGLFMGASWIIILIIAQNFRARHSLK
ncbi:hypothetical protein OAA47_00370 [Methylophilaceae bacterium]|nr:hypothetical protein [Methylophilaceae bacterium]